jgi:hypothetical protein
MGIIVMESQKQNTASSLHSTAGIAVHEALKQLAGPGNEALIYFFPNTHGTPCGSIHAAPREATEASKKETAIRAIKHIMRDCLVTLDDLVLN